MKVNESPAAFRRRTATPAAELHADAGERRVLTGLRRWFLHVPAARVQQSACSQHGQLARRHSDTDQQDYNQTCQCYPPSNSHQCSYGVQTTGAPVSFTSHTGRVCLIQNSATPSVMTHPVHNESTKRVRGRSPAGVSATSSTDPTTLIVDMAIAVANTRIIHSR